MKADFLLMSPGTTCRAAVLIPRKTSPRSEIIDDGNWQARDQAGRHHRIPTNQSADFSDGRLRLALFDLV
jgi:hypothetical protein